MPRVSVLLTCFNHLRYLPATVDGLRAQTFRDFEIIALDDASTDGTREWLLRQTDLRPFLNERNLGTYATLNHGLRFARGEFVAILNDDDLWQPAKLERQVALLDAYPRVGVASTNGGFIDENGRRTEENPFGFAYPTFETGDVLQSLAYRNRFIASAVMVRRSCFEEVGSFDEAYFGHGDWNMWWRICERYEAGFVDEPLTLYRIHGANASQNVERVAEDDVRLREFFASRFLDLGSRVGRDEQVVNFAALGVAYTKLGRKSEARKALAQAFRLYPFRLKTLARYLSTFLP